MQPETRYARSGELSIAYQVIGDGPFDLVFIPGLVSHIDAYWTLTEPAAFLEHLASFSRLIIFDKRGTGLSDPVHAPAPLEERMDDVRAVMDAAGSERAALLGLSEGGPMTVLFAATYPERTRALVLAGTFATGSLDPAENPGGQPWVDHIKVLKQAIQSWGDGGTLGLLAPSWSSGRERRLLALAERMAASPSMARTLLEMDVRIDVRDVLPTIRVPTLVIHREREFVPVANARYMAERIPGAKLVVLPGDDHLPWFGDGDTYAEEIEEFLTGVRHAREPERALATVLFTDIVGSTARAASIGDADWRDLLAEHDRRVRAQFERFRGREVKSMGDGFLATFDGPARALRCACAAITAVSDLGLELRAGVHTGECEIVGDDIGGIAVHIAARISALAKPQEVLTSSTVRDLVVGAGIEFGPGREVALKGVPGTWHVMPASVARRRPSTAVQPEPLQLRRGDRALVTMARLAPRLMRSAARRYRGELRRSGGAS